MRVTTGTMRLARSQDVPRTALVIGGADGAEVGLGEEVGQKGERQRDGADDELGGVVVDLQAFGFRPGVGSRSFGGTIYSLIVL